MILSRTLTALCAAPFATVALAQDTDPRPYDFSDAFYLTNGVDPALLVNRVDGMDGVSVLEDAPPDEDHNNVRVLLTIPAYDHAGHAVYFNAVSFLFAETFTDDAVGREAREIADAFPLYAFPVHDNPDIEIFPKRQEDVIDLRNGYFSNDPLGLWETVIVRFTDDAFTSPDGRRTLARLVWENGLSLDGTPVIKDAGDIENLTADGFMTQRRLNRDGSEGPPWFACPVIEDPRDGAIARDAFLAAVLLDDGTPLPASPEFVEQFDCLQQTGEFCDNITEPCVVDLDINGAVDSGDFFRYLDFFATGDYRADATGDGDIGADDFFEFLDRFAQGC